MKFLWFLLIPSKLRGKIPTNWNVRTVIMTNDRLVILCNIQFCRWSIKNTTTTKINLTWFQHQAALQEKRGYTWISKLDDIYLDITLLLLLHNRSVNCLVYH